MKYCPRLNLSAALVRGLVATTALALVAGSTMPVLAQPPVPPGTPAEGDLKPFADVSKGYEKVISTTDDKSFYNLWSKSKDGSLLAELPRGYENQRHFISLTIASGEEYAGLQQGDMYVYWKKMDNRLVLMEPEIATRSTGDQESKSSVKRLFTDRVILDVPILSTGPSGQPVFDMKELLAGRVAQFFGNGGFLSSGARGANPRLSSLKSAKAFPHNVEISYEMPTEGGRLKEFHYSISLIPDSTGYTPREADERVGYFTTVYRDLGKFTDKDKWVRYVNRWNLEKRDPKLKLSPPKEPIVFYIESAVPVRYRRWVRDGLLDWNKAFENIGIIDAIEVRQQDESTGAFMDLDPEDVRYNFIRWLSNDIGTAIGPSRVHPLTGQILDADIVLTDGWIRHFWVQYNQILPEIAMEGMAPETLAWLDKNPQWDPRIRLADPAQRQFLIAQRARKGVLAYGGHAIAALDPAMKDGQSRMIGTGEFDGLTGRTSQSAGLCMAATGKAFDMAMVRMTLDLMSEDELAALEPESAKKKKARKEAEEAAEKADGSDSVSEADKSDEQKEADKKKAEAKKEADKPESLDGVPEWFIGPLMRDLTCHEVGHTLGLRHNFKASSIYTMEEIASDAVKGKVSYTGSVMDYTAANMSMKDGKLTGDVTMIDIGPYDMWAIEYGYGSGDLKEVLKRNTDPLLTYGTDEDTGGPDPLARRYDFAKDPINFAKDQMTLARYHRGRLLDKFVKDGESWAKARRGYTLTLGMQTRCLSMMSNWVGGAFVNRARKGDPNATNPLQPVPAEQQREALAWVIENSFFDESFGLTPELLSKMTVDKWMDQGGFGEAMQEPTWPIHDRVAGVQSSVLTMLMNPTTLRRVFDNELLVPSDLDAVTLPEVLDTITNAVWSELDTTSETDFTARKPMISSLRRNLQREHLERMIDLAMGTGSGEAGKPVSNLATSKLRSVRGKIADVIGEKADEQGNLDAYTFAHLSEAQIRIDKALDANYIINGGSMIPDLRFLFGQTPNTIPNNTSISPEALIPGASSTIAPSPAPAAPAVDPTKP